MALACVPACAGSEPADPGDRRAAVVEPFSMSEAEPDLERFDGAIAYVLAHLDERRVGPTPLVAARGATPAEPVVVEFVTEGLRGASGRLGLLPPRGAARQEVGFGIVGQPDDPRSVWVDVEIAADGAQRFELPGPGPTWHADWAVVALELRRGTTVLPVQSGPRSEMLSDGSRVAGGRAILGVVPVTRQPTHVRAAGLAEPGQIHLDGRLDEGVWQRPGAVLLTSRTGEPADDIDAKLGGPTEVWFAWDSERLYVAASLPDRDLYTPHTKRDDPLYRDEAFEVFLAADATGERYLEHQVAANGVKFDAAFPRYREGREAWDGGWEAAIVLDGELDRRGGDRGWTVELAFPWSELCADTRLECPVAAGGSLRVNVFRLDKPEREAQVGLALSPTIEPDFHAWSNAAVLLLGEPEG